MRFTILILCLLTVFSCKKESEKGSSVDSMKSTLTAGVTKTWTLSKMYIDGSEVALTLGQARYTKTYKADNTWIDSDGYAGTYTIPNPTALTEVTTNLPSGSQTINYLIKYCSTTSLEVEYSAANTTYRLIFSL